MQRRYRRRNPRAFFVAVIALVVSLYVANADNPAPQVATAPEIITGRVIRVHDGDTFNIRDAEGRELKVRLFGIDAPEIGQAHGRESGDYLRRLINGKDVRIESQGFDQYDRLLGLIQWGDGRSLNYEMVAAGQAWVYEYYCGLEVCALLRQGQKDAKRGGVGLWGDGEAVAPWEWRRQ